MASQTWPQTMHRRLSRSRPKTNAPLFYILMHSPSPVTKFAANLTSGALPLAAQVADEELRADPETERRVIQTIMTVQYACRDVEKGD